MAPWALKPTHLLPMWELFSSIRKWGKHERPGSCTFLRANTLVVFLHFFVISVLAEGAGDLGTHCSQHCPLRPGPWAGLLLPSHFQFPSLAWPRPHPTFLLRSLFHLDFLVKLPGALNKITATSPFPPSSVSPWYSSACDTLVLGPVYCWPQ